MKKASLILVMLSTICLSAFSQVRKQYADSTEHGTTVVVKEDGASDLDILNSYGDSYSMGDVIRITTEAEPPTKAIEQQPEEPLVLTQTATTKEVAGQEDFPQEARPKRVIKKRRPLSVRKPAPVRAFVPPTPAKITLAPSASPSEYRAEGLYKKQKGKKKRNKRKRKGLFKSKKGGSCYRF